METIKNQSRNYCNRIQKNSRKISGTKSCLFENLNFIEIYFKQNDWKKKRHITSIKNERGIITTASVDAKRIINIMSNFMLINLTAWKKWTKSLKDSNDQS